MWFVKSFIYKNRYGKLPFKMRNFTESFQEECREKIKLEFEKITKDLQNIWVRINLKFAKQKMHDNYLDILGRNQTTKQPIFTSIEVAKFTQNKFFYVATLIVMVCFESILYSLMASLFIKKQTLKDFAGIEFILGFAFAIIFVLALHFAFKNMWEYFEAKHTIEKEKLAKTELKPFKKNLVIAIVILLVFIITNIYTGYIRASILEPGSSSSSSLLEKIHGPLLVFSIAITFIVALVMALLEKEITEKSIKYKVYKNWKKQQHEHKIYNTRVKEMLSACLAKRDLIIEQYWGTLKDLQRVFKIEVDEDRLELYTELNNEIQKGTIDLTNIDDSTYQKYLPIAITRHELFEYGIDSDEDIKNIISDLNSKVTEIEEFEKKNAITGDKRNGKIIYSHN